MRLLSVWRQVVAVIYIVFLLAVELAFGSEGPVVDGVTVPPDMTAQFILDDEDVSVIDFTGSMDRYISDDTPNAAARAVIAKEFFRTHADDYDFLFFFSLFNYEMNDAAAFHLGVKNDVRGIGKPLFDNTATYGSDGRLMGTIDMGSVILDDDKTDPSSAYHERLLVTSMHEILHQWGVFVKFLDPITGEVSDQLIGHQDAHWSTLVNTGGSVEYGGKWLDNGDGTFTNVAERLFYSPVDLYLMGMAKPEEVPPFYLIENSDPEIDPEEISSLGMTVSGQRKNISIDDIIAAEGLRQPAMEDAQKSFNAAFIVVKRPGQEVPPEIYGRVKMLRETAAQRFSILTGGRGILHVNSRARPIGSVGESDPINADAGEREGEFKLADALDWLRDAQRNSGEWQDRTATAYRDSLLANSVLTNLDPLYGDNRRNDFQAWLSSTTTTDNDARSRLISERMAGATEAVQVLAASQNKDGGWGIDASHASSPLDTALAVRSLSSYTGMVGAVNAGIEYLKESQNSDGGWGAVAGGDSQVGATAEVLRALGRRESVDAVRQEAASWLASRQRPDGSVGEDESRVSATAQTIWGLAAAGELDRIDITAAATWLKVRQGLNGSWGNSVFNTATAVKALTGIQSGNWIVESISADTDIIRDGDNFSITATILNNGNGITPSTTVALYLGDPANGGILIDTVAITAIGVGQGVEVSFNWDSFGSGGDQQLFVVVDPDGEFEESVELDNTGEIPVTVTPPADGADVTPGNIAMVPLTVSALPTDIGLSSTVRNIGTKDAGAVTIEWWVDDENGSHLMQTDSVELAARSNALVTASYRWESGGSRTFRIVADPDNTVVEADENNNTRSLTKSPVSGLDLAIEDSDIVLLNTPAYGQTLDAAITIRNRGTVSSPAFITDIFLESEDINIPLESMEMSLGAGEVRTIEVPWLVDREGGLRFSVLIDAANEVAELSESNNEASKAFSARVVEGSNLKVSYEDFLIAPKPLIEGMGATLRAGIQNTGNQTANNIKVRFYDGDPKSDGQLIDEIILPQIGAASNETAEGIWSSVPGNMDRILYVEVDPEDAIEEFDETDNSAFVTSTVESLPDLALQDGSVSLAPPLVASGEAFDLNVDVSNLGKQAAQGVTVSIYWDSVSDQNLLEEKVLDLAGNDSASLSFNLLAGMSGERDLLVVLDAKDEILEQKEDNNTLKKRLTVQNGDFYIDNPYISPNGDGEKDEVSVVFRLEYPAGSYLAVESVQGEEVRKIPVSEADNGNVVWDGRNALGGIVEDGRYALILRSGSGGALSDTAVIVDNNRSALTNALLEENRGYITNLTCSLPTDPFYGGGMELSEDEQRIFFDKNDEDYYPGAVNGVYRSDFSGNDIERVAALSDHPESREIRYLARNRAGNRVAYSVSFPDEGWGDFGFPKEIYEKVVGSNEPATHLMSLEDGRVTDAVYGEDDETLFVLTEAKSPSIYNATIGVLLKALGGGETDEQRVEAQLLPNQDHSRALINVSANSRYDGYVDRQNVYLLDMGSEQISTIITYNRKDGSYIESDFVGVASAERFLCQEGEECEQEFQLATSIEAVWSDDGSRFAVGGADKRVKIFDKNGAVISDYPLPGVGEKTASMLMELNWSSDSTQLAFYYGGSKKECGYCPPEYGGYLNVLDLLTGRMKALYPYYHYEIPHSFHVSTWNGEEWVVRAETHHPIGLDERIAEISSHLPDAAGRYRVRITQVGHEEGFIDQLAMLTASGNPVRPFSVKMINDGKDVTDSLSRRDYAMIDLHNTTLEAEWEASRLLSGNISLFAQESSPSRMKIHPFNYPDRDENAYRVPLKSGKSWDVDGKQEEESLLGRPLFETFSRPDSAHRSAIVRGYASSDKEALYAALDFAVDSTAEDRGDWAALEVKTKEGWRRFTVDVENQHWGRVAFTSSKNASWGHRYYEFRIPLRELGLTSGGVAQVRFQAYGSAGLEGSPDLIDGVPGLNELRPLIWLPSDNALLYSKEYGYGKSSVIRFSDDEKSIDDVVAPVDFSDGVHLSPRKRKLLYMDYPEEDTCNLDRYGDRVRQYYSLDTIDNLTVDLRVLRSPGAGGFSIFGTVSDAYFDHFTLSYSMNGHDGWKPIRPAGTKQYKDELITSWIPPEKGRYFVRLTGYDKAGNSLSSIKQAVWSDQSPITDIYVDQDLFSPNSDGNKDSLGLHFRVRSPVNISVQIYSDDTLIRSFEGAYDTIGQEVWLYWDGRDQNGRVVPDGDYRLEIMGVEYIVTVDNTFPELLLEMSDSPYGNVCIQGAPQYRAEIIVPPVNYQAKCETPYKGDNNFLGMNYLLKAGTHNNEPNLVVIVESSFINKDEWNYVGQTQGEIGGLFSLSEKDIGLKKYRARARDAAGNEELVEYVPSDRKDLATVVRAGPYLSGAQLSAEFYWLGEPIPFDGGKSFGDIANFETVQHFTISETLGAPIIAVYAEFRSESMENWQRDAITDFLHADWNACKVMAFYNKTECGEAAVDGNIDDDRIHFLWDTRKLQPAFDRNWLRFVLLTADGEEIYTPRLSVAPRTFNIKNFEAPKLIDNSNLAIWGNIFVIDELESLDIYVSSDEDDRFSKEKLLGGVLLESVAVVDGERRYEVDATALMHCTKYKIRAVMQLVGGRSVTVKLEVSTPCMKALYRVEYPNGLHEEAKGNSVKINVWPVSLSDIPIKSLEIYAPLDNGQKDVLATANDISNGNLESFSIDTSDWPSGETFLAIRLVDDLDAERTESFSIYKDVASPELTLSSPLEGQLVCGRQPFQISYSDSTGGLADGDLPEGWAHNDRIYKAIVASKGSATSQLDGESMTSRANNPFLNAVNSLDNENDVFKSIINNVEIPFSSVNKSAEFVVEALAQNGTTLQRFPLWDEKAMPPSEYPDLTGPETVGRELRYRDYVELPWELGGDNGSAIGVTLRLIGTDAYGNVSRLERAIEIDTAAAIPEVSLDDGTNIIANGRKAFISPNGDGVQDNILIRIRNHESGSLELRLYSEDESGPDSGLIGVIYRDELAQAGDYEYLWDGTVNGGVVPDGAYSIAPVLRDACGNVSPFDKDDQRAGIVIDTVAPYLSEIEPANDSPVALVAHLYAKIEELNLDVSDNDAVAQYYRPSGSANEVSILHRVDEVSDNKYQVIADWNTYGLSGFYELIWRVADRAGNVSEKIVSVNALSKADLLSSLEIDTPYISPNGDGRLDQLRYRIGVLQPVNITIALLSQGGEHISDIFNGVLQPGENSLVWDGAINDSVVADREYQIRVIANSIEFPSLEQEATQRFSVDKAAPELVLPKIENGFLQAPFALSIAINDDAMDQYKVILESELGSEVLAEGGGVLAESALKKLTDVEQEGSYLIDVQASDLAGNTLRERIPFNLDVTPPIVNWLAPQISYIGGEEVEILDWVLSIDDAHPGSLNVSLVEENGDSISLHSGNVENGEISGDADIKVLHGNYVLSASMTDDAGNETRKNRELKIDHRKPSLVISGPEDNSFITGRFTVLGKVDDDHLKRWALGFQADEMEPLAAVDSGDGLIDGVFGTYDPPEDGEYRLVLQASDMLGYSSETEVRLTVDTIPPVAPSNLAVEEESGGARRLTWKPSPSEDVKHYLVYDQGQEIAGPVAETSFGFVPNENHPYLFTVLAVDHAGLLSETSLPLSWTLDTQGPAVTINNPSSGELVGGLLNVIGSASGPDLETYSLSVSTAQSPESWQQVATGSLQKLGERLGQWNTLDSQGDGDYTIRLRALDQTGNVSVTSVAVTVDNTPPDAPLALQAEANGNDVTLTWSESPSLDVKGYLLMRNDKIVNAPGLVVGDVTPWLIEDMTYLDAAVVDGAHLYTVYAVDKAGNISEPAESRLELDLRSPELNWVLPDSGSSFENALTLLAESEDQDLERVKFRYRAVHNTSWVELTPDAVNRPYVLGWDTSELPYGDYEIQAEAWDRGGQTGITATRQITKYDLTPPLPATDLTAIVSEGTVSLAWQPSSSEDLAEYVITLVDEITGAGQEVARVIKSAVSYDVTDLEDGLYHFQVSAVDEAGNTAVDNSEVETLVFTPVVNQWESIITSPGTAFSGYVEAGSQIEVYRIVEGDRSLLTSLPVSQQGEFASEMLPMLSGMNALVLQAVTENGDRSHEVELNIARVTIPGKVLNLSYEILDQEQPDRALLSWQPPENAPEAYYLVRSEDNQLLINEEPLSPSGYTSSSEYPPYGRPDYAFDGDQYSSFLPYDRNWDLDLTFVDTAWLSSLEMTWEEEPASVHIAANINGAWKVVADIQKNGNEAKDWSLTLDPPQPAQALRLVVISENQRARLSEMSIHQMDVRQDTSFEYVSEGKEEASLSVAAINMYGIDGEQEYIDIQVGDWVAPETVTLSGGVQESNVELSWNPSSSHDIDSFLVYRNGQPVANVDGVLTEYLDHAVANGTHQYQVRPVDLSGNVGEFSNLVTLTVSVASPEAPSYVDSTPNPLTGCINLEWANSPGDVAYYIVYRRENGGELTELVQVAENSYLDCDLYPGIDYQYEVVAVDAAGNSSASSSSESMEAEDQTPPSAPSILLPVPEGNTFDTDSSRVSIEGVADAGDTVVLLRNGFQIAETLAQSKAGGDGGEVYEEEEAWGFWLSPNAENLVIGNFDDSLDVLNREDNELLQRIDPMDDAWPYDIAWLDEQRFAVLRIGTDMISVEVNDLESNTVLPITSWESGYWEILNWHYNRDIEKIVLHVRFDFGEKTQMLLVDPVSGEQQDVLSDVSDGQGSPRVAPSGNRVLWGESTSYIRDLITGEDQMVACPGVPVAWMRSPEIPVLAGPEGLVACAEDGSTTVIYDDLPNLENVNQEGTLPAGIQMILWEKPVNGLSTVRAFDGNSLFKVGSIPFDKFSNISVDGFIPETQRIWFTYWDVDKDSGGIWLASAASNFEFSNTRVGSGLNEFRVLAKDRFANKSDPSGAIYINAKAEPSPNLVVNIEAKKAVALGGSVPISVTVTNTGNVDLPGTDLDISLYRDGATDALAMAVVSSLNAGESETLTFDWVADEVGVTTVEARLDTAHSLSESSISDNYDSHEVRVSADYGLSLAIHGDYIAEKPGKMQPVSWELANPGLANYQGSLVFAVVSLNGDELQEVSRLPVSSLPSGETVSGKNSVTVPELQPGKYQLRLSFLSSAIDYPVTDSIDLEVLSDMRLSGVVSGANQHYAANSDVLLGIDISHVGKSGILQSGTLETSIERSGGGLIKRWQKPLATILPGDIQRHVTEWNTATESPGSYIFRAVVSDEEGNILLEREAVFSIDASILQVSGMLDVENGIIGYQKPLLVSWQLQNEGNVALSDMAIAIEARRVGVAPIGLLSESITLPVSAIADDSQTLSSIMLGFGNWTLVLTAKTEVDGVSYEHVIATTPLSVRDIDAPLVTLLSPEAGSIFNSNSVVLTAQAFDEQSGMDGLQWRANDGNWQDMYIVGNAYSASLALLDEGPVTLAVRGIDGSGNVSVPINMSLVVDNSPPEMQISGVANNGFYPSAVQPVVSAEDASSVTMLQMLDGVSWDGESIAEEGRHELFVQAIDPAGNTATDSIVFTIDSRKPIISIDGAADDGLYNRPVTPKVYIDDDNIADSQVTLNGSPWTDGSTIVDDGVYVLMAIANDLAGNTTVEKITFTVDTLPPEPPSITSVSDGDVVHQSAMNVEGVAEPGSRVALEAASGSYAAITDETGYFRFESVLFSEGENTLSVRATDVAGNVGEGLSLSFTVQLDVSAPEILISGVSDGGHYGDAVTPKIEVTDESAIIATEILLNGDVYESGAVIDADGAYKMVVHAEDEHGNSADKEISFNIDKVPPVIAINGVSDNGEYNSPVKPEVSVDDLSPVNVEVTLNDDVWVSGSDVAEEGDYLLKVIAVDLVGNQAVKVVRFRLDFTAPLPPVIETPLADGLVSGPNVQIAGYSEPLADIEIKVGGGIYGVSADDSGMFSLQTSLADGDYQIDALAIDMAGNRSAVATVEFRVSSTEVEIEPAPSGDMSQILIWQATLHGHRCPYHAPGETEHDWYVETLRALGFNVTAVNNESDFRSELASGRHNIIMLVGQGGDFGQPLYMSADTIMRVRGSIASGYGLVWINTLPNLLETWHDIIGARTVSVLSDVDDISYSVDGQNTLESGYRGRVSGILPLGGAEEGRVYPNCSGLLLWGVCHVLDITGAHFPAAVVNKYGRGQVKMLTFDPMGIDAQSEAEAVLQDVLEDVRPTSLLKLPFVPVLNEVSIKRIGQNMPVRVMVSVPQDLLLIGGEGSEEVDSTTTEWSLSAEDTELNVRYRIVAEQSGDYVVTVRAVDPSTEMQLAKQVYPFQIEQSDQVLLEALKDAMTSEIQDHPWQLTLRMADQFLDGSIDDYGAGKYRHAYDHLYMAMLKLRLSPSYDRELMALMGDYQRLLIGRL